MRIVGIDPGSRFMGWGIIEQSGNRLQCINYGVLKLGDGLLADRLVLLDQELAAILRREKPESAAIEGMFYAKSAKSAAVLGHARGVCMLCLRRAGRLAPQARSCRRPGRFRHFAHEGRHRMFHHIWFHSSRAGGHPC